MQCKSLGSSSHINVARATIKALQMLRRPEEIAKLRGLSVDAVLGLGGEAPATNGDAPAEAEAETPAEEVSA